MDLDQVFMIHYGSIYEGGGIINNEAYVEYYRAEEEAIKFVKELQKEQDDVRDKNDYYYSQFPKDWKMTRNAYWTNGLHEVEIIALKIKK